MKIQFVAIVAIIGTIGLSSIMIPQAHAQVSVPSTATILGVCGLAATPPAIDYGVLAPNAESTDKTLQITNTGNAQANVLVKGTDWSTASIVNAMPVGATKYSLSSGQSYDSKTAMTTSDTELTTLNAVQSKNTYFQLKIILSDPSSIGPTTQTVTLTGQC